MIKATMVILQYSIVGFLNVVIKTRSRLVYRMKERDCPPWKSSLSFLDNINHVFNLKPTAKPWQLY